MKELWTMQNDDCTYAVDLEKRLLYISLSFEDLHFLDQCEDYFVINIDEYEATSENDTIQELINEIQMKGMI